MCIWKERGDRVSLGIFHPIFCNLFSEFYLILIFVLISLIRDFFNVVFFAVISIQFHLFFRFALVRIEGVKSEIS